MKLAQVRIKQAMNRATLSKLSGVPYRTIENWEKGIRKPRDVYQLKRVAEALGVTIEDII